MTHHDNRNRTAADRPVPPLNPTAAAHIELALLIDTIGSGTLSEVVEATNRAKEIIAGLILDDALGMSR